MFSQNVPHIRQTLSPQSFIIIARPKYFTSNVSYDLWHRIAWQQVDTNSRWMQDMKDRWKVRGIRQCSPPCQWTQMRLTPAAWEGNLSDISCLCICCDKYISPKQGDVAAMEVKEKTMELLCRLLVHVEGWTGVAFFKVGIPWSLGLSAQEEAWTWWCLEQTMKHCIVGREMYFSAWIKQTSRQYRVRPIYVLPRRSGISDLVILVG